MRDKKAGNAYSAAGDDDINDVAAMGGVNLAEEANVGLHSCPCPCPGPCPCPDSMLFQRIMGNTESVGTVVRSCKDETFLQTGLLHQRISRICREKVGDLPALALTNLVQGLDAPPPEVIALVSHATQVLAGDNEKKQIVLGKKNIKYFQNTICSDDQSLI